MEWQPIETAPKDGRVAVLVAFEQGVAQPGPASWWVGEAYWHEHAKRWYAAGTQPFAGDWTGPIDPEFWMPLPDPPAAGEDRSR